MAHFAQVDVEGVVLRVIVVDNSVLLDMNGQEDEFLGQRFCRHHFCDESQIWYQTSYNSSFRKNYAGIGYTYDQGRDAFIPPKPFPSWVLDEETCIWHAPVTMPSDGKYAWNEDTQTWENLDG